MDVVERKVAERLAAAGEGAEPPIDLAERVRSAVGRRKRRRRAGVVTLVAAVVVGAPVVAVTVGDVLDRPSVEPGPAGTTGNEDHPGDIGELAGSSDITSLIEPETLVEFPRIADGEVTYTTIMDDDGTLVTGGDGGLLVSRHGDSQAEFVEWLPHGAVWRGLSDGVLYWLDRPTTPEEHFVACMPVDGTGEFHQLTDRELILQVAASGGAVAWVNESEASPTLWVARGCPGDPEPVHSTEHLQLAAFSYPDAFIRSDWRSGSDSSVVSQVDVTTGEVVAEFRIDAVLVEVDGIFAPRWPLLAASETTVAWTGGSTLTIQGRDDGSRAVFPGLPMVEGEYGVDAFLTTGTRVVAYSSIPLDDWEPGEDAFVPAESLVYDRQTHDFYRVSGVVLAAGDWLLWHSEDGQTYYLGRVRS